MGENNDKAKQKGQKSRSESLRSCTWDISNKKWIGPDFNYVSQKDNETLDFQDRLENTSWQHLRVKGGAYVTAGFSLHLIVELNLNLEN